MKTRLVSYRCEYSEMAEAVRIIIREKPVVPLTEA